MNDILIRILMAIDAVVCLMLIGIILIQKSKGRGMGLSFGGGAPASETISLTIPARPAAPAVGNPVANAQTRPAQGQGIQGNNRPAARDGQHPNGQNAAMGNTAGAPRQTWGQNGQGQQSGQGQHTSSFQRPGANPPANGAQGQGQTRAPYGANGFNNNRPAGGNPGNARPASFGNNANAGGQRPAGQRPGNFAGRDRDEGNSAPRETFKVQTITRGQTPNPTSPAFPVRSRRSVWWIPAVPTWICPNTTINCIISLPTPQTTRAAATRNSASSRNPHALRIPAAVRTRSSRNRHLRNRSLP